MTEPRWAVVNSVYYTFILDALLLLYINIVLLNRKMHKCPKNENLDNIDLENWVDCCYKRKISFKWAWKRSKSGWRWLSLLSLKAPFSTEDLRSWSEREGRCWIHTFYHLVCGFYRFSFISNVDFWLFWPFNIRWLLWTEHSSYILYI